MTLFGTILAKYEGQPRDELGQWTTGDGTVQMNHGMYQEKVKGQSDEALRFTIKDAGDAIAANPTGKKAGYYADEIHYAAGELRNRAVAKEGPPSSKGQTDTPTTKTGRTPGKDGGTGSYDQGFEPGDRVKVAADRHNIGGKSVTVVELAPSRKFLVVEDKNGGQHSLHESDITKLLKAEEDELATNCIAIKKTDDERQLVYGEVYAPMVPDSHGDYMTAAQIEKAAHKFMANGPVGSIDMEHNLKDTGSVVVESFIARSDDPTFMPGAWVVAAHVVDPKLWKLVKGGEINGFSMYGHGVRTERDIEIELPDDGIIKGEVAEAGEESHTHTFIVKYNDKGEFEGGETSKDAGHKHQIRKGSVTEEADGHSHRFSYSGVIVHEG